MVSDLLEARGEAVRKASNVDTLLLGIADGLGTSLFDFGEGRIPWLGPSLGEQAHTHGTSVDQGHGLRLEEIKVFFE